MRKSLLSLIIIISFLGILHAQPEYRVFGIHSGLTMASQRWNSGNRSVLFRPHIDVSYEKYRPGQGLSFYGSLGYHQRGNSEVIQVISFSNGSRENRRINMIHQNVVTNIGVKGRIPKEDGNALFYLIAARVEANMGNQFDIYEGLESAVNPIVAGATFSFGYEWLFTSKSTVVFGLHLQPDFTNQIYLQPQVFTDSRGNTRNFQEERIRNFSIELSVGYQYFKDTY